MSGRRKPRLLVLNQYYWPGIEATAQLLTELCEALAEDMEVTVVDNASRDGSAEMVAAHFPWVHLIRNDRNRGCA